MRLKDLREESHATQQSIAEYLHCDQSLYSKYEREERDVPIWILIKLSDFYNTSIDYLVERTDKREKYPNQYRKNRNIFKKYFNTK